MADETDYEEMPKQFEYLDHTADVQIHSWGKTMPEAFEQACQAMFNYMTDINGILPKKTVEIHAKGSDSNSLLFSFLDEFLFLSSSDDYFMLREVHILEFDRENWTIHARAFGEDFDMARHGGQGTEVKAITYSAMQVVETEDKTDVFVIIDI